MIIRLLKCRDKGLPPSGTIYVNWQQSHYISWEVIVTGGWAKPNVPYMLTDKKAHRFAALEPIQSPGLLFWKEKPGVRKRELSCPRRQRLSQRAPMLSDLCWQRASEKRRTYLWNGHQVTMG